MSAGLAFTVIDGGVDIEIGAGLAVGVDVIAQRAAAGGQRIIERLGDGCRQPVTARLGKFAGRRGRVDAGAEQAFRSIDIADAHHCLPGQQGLFDGL